MTQTDRDTPVTALRDAAREVVRFYGTDRTWSLMYRTLLGSRIDDLARALASSDDVAGSGERPVPGDYPELRELIAVEQAAVAWVAAHPARKDSCTIWDCPTATRLRAAVDVAAAAVNERVRAAFEDKR